jgi:cysteine-rich repeat protein
MKTIVILFGLCSILAAGSAIGQPVALTTVDCKLPTAAVPEARDVLCENLRQRLGRRSAGWSVVECASWLLGVGLEEEKRKVAKKEARELTSGHVSDEMNAWHALWPEPVRAICGDGIVDTEAPFFEVCDDGNQVDDDGCDNVCGR